MPYRRTVGMGANGLLLNGSYATFSAADPYYSKLMQLSPQSLAMGGNIDDLLAMQNAASGSASVSTAQTCTTPACLAAGAGFHTNYTGLAPIAGISPLLLLAGAGLLLLLVVK